VAEKCKLKYLKTIKIVHDVRFNRVYDFNCYILFRFTDDELSLVRNV